ncbi:hypothetical protein SCBWM1_gp130 [Synechococcus phage S-CBWM1]|uniref:Uncharacterized protein n=1 Tax=Synechococcus phage S-CBWM1 TaxID=2053653 RepID=A0A3G1L3Q0_9CAUD|nr:hypothetical protein HOU61_gp067 [Synechococcus phage S-CBWM1]ATW62814.1 hypothetical protein SCBWM1_gp130 [Synechococcus phage S-CBWM1]
MNNQSFQIHWKLALDFPPRDGKYLVCFLLRDGTYGDPEYMNFRNGEWECFEEDYPEFWTDLPLPLNK